jgi:hypothetical protein
MIKPRQSVKCTLALTEIDPRSLIGIDPPTHAVAITRDTARAIAKRRDSGNAIGGARRGLQR